MPTIADIAATTVALAALGVAVWQGWLQRKHARLTLMPNIDTFSKDVIESPDDEIGVWVMNTGLGPGRVTSIRIFVDGEELPSMDEYSAYREALKERGVYATNQVVQSRAILPPGERWGLFTLRLDAFPREDWPSIHKAFLEGNYRLRIEIDYESLYGERGETEVMDLAKRVRPIRPLPDDWFDGD